MSEPEMRVVTVSSIWDETPEAMYRMDRLLRRYEEERAALDPEVRELADRVDAELTRRFVEGT